MRIRDQSSPKETNGNIALCKARALLFFCDRQAQKKGTHWVTLARGKDASPMAAAFVQVGTGVVQNLAPKACLTALGRSDRHGLTGV